MQWSSCGVSCVSEFGAVRGGGAGARGTVAGGSRSSAARVVQLVGSGGDVSPSASRQMLAPAVVLQQPH